MLQQYLVHGFSSSVLLYLLQQSLSDLSLESSEDDHFELSEALICQIGDAAVVDEKSVKVSKEPLHPSDHDLMVLPAEVELFEEHVSIQILEPGSHFFLEIAGD